MIHDASTDDITLEGGDIALEGWGELPIFLSHAIDGKLGDSISGGVLVFKCCPELSKEVIPDSKSHSSTSNGFFMEGVCPS